MKLIFVDRNKSLVEKVAKLFTGLKDNKWDVELSTKNADIFEVQKETQGVIVTASNPDFDMSGGLDLQIAQQFKEETENKREFLRTQHLFYTISVNKNRKSSKKLILRALAGVFLIYCHTSETVILSGLGTSIGGLAEGDFVDVLRLICYANLNSADLSYANLRYANLRSANLSYANLRSANLSSANLSYANLSSANLSSADLSYANLSYANLSYANLSSADLSYANLSSANLRSANLRSADLSSADLSSANLSSADLSYANLSYANLSSADLSSADLRYANLSRTEFDGLTVREFLDMYNLKVKKGKVILYKGLDSNRSSPIVDNQRIEYKKNKIVEDEFVNFRVYDECAHGLHCCPTLELAKCFGQLVVRVEVDIIDFVAIPGKGEKVRVKRLKVLD